MTIDLPILAAWLTVFSGVFSLGFLTGMRWTRTPVITRWVVVIADEDEKPQRAEAVEDSYLWN